MFTLTIDWCRDNLYEIVKDHGADFRYKPPGSSNNPVCVNHYNGKPSCIIGHLLYRLGVPLDQMINGGCGSTIQNLVSRGLVENPSESVVEYLSSVQYAQDNMAGDEARSRNTWGTALAAGDQFLRQNNLLSNQEERGSK